MALNVLDQRRTEIPLPRRGGPNSITGPSGKPLLVIVEGADIDAMIDAGLEAIGGLKRVVQGNREVLLKPNTNQRDPFPSITDPATIRAVARHARAAGVERVVVHEDHKHELDYYYQPSELPGLDLSLAHAPTRDDFVLVGFDGWHSDMPVPFIPASGASGMLERLRGYEPQPAGGLRIARDIQMAPIVINMPVLKRHFAGQITSALKNHFGSVYGPHRWLAHASLDTNRDYYDRKLAEFASAVRPELTITDVRSLQAVAGPNRGPDTRIVERVNRLIVSGDMVAADVVAMDIMKRHDPTFSAQNEAIVRRQHRHAENLGLGCSDLSKFEVVELKI
ncbi:MAG TPA: DUF362 domain-containing protein [Chloroflexota bacterium]|nr:DUF362 domain-containing protein [Chloroflexota bacterium]